MYILHIEILRGRKELTWFTEWTENKIGTVNSSSVVPFNIQLSQNAITIQQGGGNTIDINIINNNTTSKLQLQLVASGTFSFSKTGGLDNATAVFTDETLTFDMLESNNKATLLLNLSQDTKPGVYSLMVGAEHEDITYSKAIRVTVI